MPTNFASNATAPRIRSTSAANVCSASGRGTRDVSLVVVEPGLENQLRGDRVAACAARSCADIWRGECGGGALRREPFVDARDAQSEARFELPREAGGVRRH